MTPNPGEPSEPSAGEAPAPAKETTVTRSPVVVTREGTINDAYIGKIIRPD